MSTTTVGPVTGAAGPATSLMFCTELAARVRMTVPSEQPVTVTDQVVPDPVGSPTTQPVAVPPVVNPAAVRPVTGELKVSWYERLVAFVAPPTSEVKLF